MAWDDKLLSDINALRKGKQDAAQSGAGDKSSIEAAIQASLQGGKKPAQPAAPATPPKKPAQPAAPATPPKKPATPPPAQKKSIDLSSIEAQIQAVKACRKP